MNISWSHLKADVDIKVSGGQLCTILLHHLLKAHSSSSGSSRIGIRVRLSDSLFNLWVRSGLDLVVGFFFFSNIEGSTRVTLVTLIRGEVTFQILKRVQGGSRDPWSQTGTLRKVGGKFIAMEMYILRPVAPGRDGAPDHGGGCLSPPLPTFWSWRQPVTREKGGCECRSYQGPGQWWERMIQSGLLLGPALPAQLFLWWLLESGPGAAAPVTCGWAGVSHLPFTLLEIRHRD